MSEVARSPRVWPKQAGLDPYSLPLAAIDVTDPELYITDTWGPFFARLRAEDPVHWSPDSPEGPHWDVTKFNDIQYVDSHHELFSSEPSITLEDPAEDFSTPMFIAMDPPLHDIQRKVVQPVVAPRNLSMLEPVIRQRMQGILDSLPIGETFNWVDRVSIELTTQMLATLFDFPFEERRKLTYWSDISTASPDLLAQHGLNEETQRQELLNCMMQFTQLWHERASRAPGNDLISMLAHDPSTRDMVNRPMEFLGNLILLIVGGNDTTRNSISGGVLALNQFPGEYAKLRNNPSVIPNMVPEIIRFQTPLSYMRRRAVKDTELNGKKIREGDRIAMWYISGNRDDEVIDRPDEFIIDRPNVRHHMSFGFGIHRCMGNRLAEMQLRIVWEEISKRFHFVEVVGEPKRVDSNFVHGFSELPVRLHPI